MVGRKERPASGRDTIMGIAGLKGGVIGKDPGARYHKRHVQQEHHAGESPVAEAEADCPERPPEYPVQNKSRPHESCDGLCSEPPRPSVQATLTDVLKKKPATSQLELYYNEDDVQEEHGARLGVQRLNGTSESVGFLSQPAFHFRYLP